jgi:uncharacterized protein
MANGAVALDPVKGKARLDSLDVLRGIAILGILYMNIPYMATVVTEWMNDPRRLSWTPLDQGVFAFIGIVWEGTQRGLFEMLFGAGVLILTAKAMKPNDPVAVADLFYRRNLLLILFGLIDIFIIGWVGDILLIYGLAALFLFPLRRLSPRILLGLGTLWALALAIGLPGQGSGYMDYHERSGMIAEAAKLEERREGGAKLSKEDSETLEAFAAKQAALDPDEPLSKEAAAPIKEERASHKAGPIAMLGFNWSVWNKVFGDGNGTFFSVLEALCTMFVGMALFKWGVIQGERSARFYALLAVGAYAVGFGLRGWGMIELFRFDLQPKISGMTFEFGRLAVTLGHVGLFNLLLKFRLGARVLSPFKAAGQMAFTIYIFTSIVTLWIVFGPWAWTLWDTLGWTELMLAATAINAGMLLFANLWLWAFRSGPLEWLWRSLAYGKRQQLRQPATDVPLPPPGPLPGPAEPEGIGTRPAAPLGGATAPLPA